MITVDDYLGEKKTLYSQDLSSTVESNITDLLNRVNLLLNYYKCYENKMYVPHINSGWRPKSYNDTIPKASKTSHHITGCAIDLRDEKNTLGNYLKSNEDVLETCGLWMESPSHTKGWCHLQSKPFRSWVKGKTRIFNP